MKDWILLKAGDVRIAAALNDTAAARDFKRRLPLSVSGRRSACSYCFPAAIGCFDPEETQIGWKNGDICISGGRLEVFFDGEKTSGNSVGVMVIAHIREEDLNLMQGLPDNVRLKIEAAVQAAESGETVKNTTAEKARAGQYEEVRKWQ